MKHLTRGTAAAAALIVVGVLAGCGDSSDHGSMPGMTEATKSEKTVTPGEATPARDHNDADVTFASQMILHHQQALQMASMAGYQATTAAVKELATGIRTAQESEMQQMSGLLTNWGKPVPSPSHGGDEMSHSLPGMLSDDELSELGKAKGAMFDRMWTQMMITHHQGAVTMAKVEHSAGRNAAAIALAKQIAATQTAEIATMQRLLGRLPIG